MKQLIQKLTETFSPSGYETAIREVIRKEIKPFADEVRVDALGNLVCPERFQIKKWSEDHAGGAHGRDWSDGHSH